MYKFAGSILLVALLGACSTAPVVDPKVSSVQGLLKPDSVAYVQLPNKLKLTGANFDVNSHSLIGLAIVVAAATTMEAQSAAWEKTYADYLHTHPDALPLETVFDNELKKDLLVRGIAVKNVLATSQPADDKKTAYSVMASSLDVKNVVVLDNLVSFYYAPSSLDGYNPRSGVRVSEVPNNAGFVVPIKQQIFEVEEFGTVGQYYFPSFISIQSDPERGYLGLQRSISALADKVAVILVASNSK